jgi:hypothetical protein
VQLTLLQTKRLVTLNVPLSGFYDNGIRIIGKNPESCSEQDGFINKLSFKIGTKRP